MISTDIWVIEPSDLIAQILLLLTKKSSATLYLPHKSDINKHLSKEIYFSQNTSVHRPTCTIKLRGKSFTELVDTGDDVTIVNRKSWLFCLTGKI